MRFELTAEQQEFHDKVRAFADRAVRPRAALIDDTDDFPHDIVKEAGAFGLMGLTVPTPYGGGGLDYVSYALAIETVSHASATVGVILAVNNSLVAEVVAQYGSDEQREPTGSNGWRSARCSARLLCQSQTRARTRHTS